MGNREDLLAGAKRCLAEKGYAATTVRDIAGAAKVSMAAIGYHFGSREALLNAALIESIDEWGQTLGAAIGAVHKRGKPATRYQDLWARMIESFHQNRALFLASLEATVLAEHSPRLREQLANGQWEGRSGLAAQLLETGEDTLSEADVKGIGSVQMALITGIIVQHLTDPDRSPAAADVVRGLRALADLIEEGPPGR